MTSQRRWGNVFIGLALLYFVFSGNRGLWNLYKLYQQKQNLNEQIVLLKSDINHYQVEYQAFEKNTVILEKQAREELNLIKPGEMVYKFAKTESH